MQADADSLGGYLRQERELRHLSLQDISAATKVQLTFLQALERNDYDRLPPAPFVVGFLRAYAQCLNLHPEAIVAVYHQLYGSSERLHGHQLPVAYQVRRSRPIAWKGIGVIVAVMVLLAGFTWSVLRSGSEARPGAPPLAAEHQLEKAKAAAPVAAIAASETRLLPPSERVSTLPQASPVPAAERPQSIRGPAASDGLGATPSTGELLARASEQSSSLTPSETLVLQATAVEDTWLRVDVDGKDRHALLLTAGKSVQWEARNRFVLKIGNARGTRLMVNGRDVSLPPTADNVVRDFVLTRDMAH